MITRKSLWAIMALLNLNIYAQLPCDSLLPGAAKRIKQDVYTLASDKMAGREPGTQGANMAAAYIQMRYGEIGLIPAGNRGGYRQDFPISLPVSFGSHTVMVMDDESFKLYEDYFPVQFSVNGAAEGKTIYVKYGIVAPEMGYNDYEKIKPSKAEGRIFVMDISSPGGIHPHSEYLKYHDLGERIDLAIKKGAIAVILINLEGTANDMDYNFRTLRKMGVPVVFVTNNTLAAELTKKKRVSITAEIQRNRTQAFNILGRIDNQAEKTIVIGAHYDHLGMGGKNSLNSDKKPAIHNGADDNASGVAALLELARNITAHKELYQKNNYLFIAFSGEEKGLLGSAYFTDNMTGTLNVNYMLNMDMVGRLEEYTLAVNGVGTSPQWTNVINRKTACQPLVIKTSEGGVGPSDHTNFYYKNIPVLHFFTGTHMDYHKPTDDASKINLEGEVLVIRYILDIIKKTQDLPKLEFTATLEKSQMVPKFSVTLGVMPDYMYDGQGMRIDGVTDGKPASQAGLQAGDVVTHLGEVKVVDMMSYMKALGQFKKGDKAEIEYMRDGKTATATIEF